MGKTMSEVDWAIGRRVRARRVALKINQTELGDAIGVRFQQVQKYETGANRTSAARLWKIAEVLEVPVSFFFEGLGDEANGATGLAISLDDPETLEMLGLMRGLSAERKSAIRAMMRAI